MVWYEATAEQVMAIQAAIALSMAALLAAVGILGGFAHLTDSSSSRAAAWRGAVSGAIVVLAVVSAITYFWLSRSWGFLHRWDLFHTAITARYIEELGYFKLYECAYVIDDHTHGRLRSVDKIRDLHTLRYVRASTYRASSDCESRFSPERRAAFARDLDFFYRLSPDANRWKRLFKDKGYNGTPLYTALVRFLLGDRPLSVVKLHMLAILDVAMLLYAFAFVCRAFGWRVALVGFVFFCVNFPNRFVHMGGSLLRFDYVVYLIIAFGCVRLGRYGPAGALVALATMERGFPALFALGLASRGAREWLRTGHLDTRYRVFLAAFAGAGAVCFTLSLAPDGLEAWRGFAENIEVHVSRSASFRIGLPHLFMLDGNLFGPDGFVSFEEKARLFASRAGWYWLSVVLLLAPLAHLVRRLDDLEFAGVFFVLTFFAVMFATRYYYSVLVLLFLLGPDPLRQRGYSLVLASLFLLSFIAYAVTLANPFAAFVYNTLFTSMLLTFHVGLLAWLVLRRAPDEPRAGIA